MGRKKLNPDVMYGLNIRTAKEKEVREWMNEQRENGVTEDVILEVLNAMNKIKEEREKDETGGYEEMLRDNGLDLALDIKESNGGVDFIDMPFAVELMDGIYKVKKCSFDTFIDWVLDANGLPKVDINNNPIAKYKRCDFTVVIDDENGIEHTICSKWDTNKFGDHFTTQLGALKMYLEKTECVKLTTIRNVLEFAVNHPWYINKKTSGNGNVYYYVANYTPYVRSENTAYRTSFHIG